MLICDISVLHKYGKHQLDQLLSPLQSNWNQMIILMVLERAPGCHQSYLSSYLHTDKGNLTKLINSMVSSNLIERKISTTDRRYNCLYLTEKGQQLLPALHRVLAAWEAKCYECFTTQELETYKNLNKKIVQALMESTSSS